MSLRGPCHLSVIIFGTPHTVRATIEGTNHRAIEVDVIPSSGTTHNCFPASILPKMGYSMSDIQPLQMRTILSGGEDIYSKGVMKLMVSYGGKSTLADCLIYDTLVYPVLSLDCMAALNLLPGQGRNKSTSCIPFFFGDPDNDEATARALIDKINLQGAKFKLTPEQKCDLLTSALQGPASEWLDMVEETSKIDTKSWDELSSFFLETYDREFIPKLQDVKQRETEKVIDFAMRCYSMFGKIREICQERRTSPIRVTHRDALDHPDLVGECLEVGAYNAIHYLKQLVFRGGLQEHIREEVAKKEYMNTNDCVKAALEVEELLEMTRKLSVAEDEHDDDDEESDYAQELSPDSFDDEPGAASQRQTPPRNSRQMVAPPSGRKDKRQLDCWHCGKMGHIISECYSKKNGKPKNPTAGPKKAQKRKVVERQLNWQEVAESYLNWV